MPKKKKKARPKAFVHVQQPGAGAARDLVGVANHYYGDAGTQGAASLVAALPPVEAGFTGRNDDLARLRTAVEAEDGSGVSVVLAAGMGGVGKTQLALSTAHRALGDKVFSRALFLDLRGYTTPVDAHRALQALLVSLGVPQESIPEDGDARAGVYRAALDARAREQGGPVLVVADNASRPDQVQPLVPGPGGHRLLVTSRERLGGLPARQVSVGLLTDPQAFQVLVADLRLADPDDERVHDLQGLTELARACAGLPLALRIAAGQLKNAPDMEAGELARTLSEGADRILHFRDHRELHAVFASSTDRLPAEQRDLFTMLGMIPGPDISTAAAAALAGTNEREVLVRLRGLAASHLVAGSQGRWTMHDLVAAYATSLTGSKPSSRFARAQRRLLDHYAGQVTDAAQRLQPLPGKEVPDTFASPERAWEWLDAERAVLINAVHTAHRTGHTRATIMLPLNLSPYLDRQRLFHDQITITRLALATAQRLGDRSSEAPAWNNLGNALREVRRFDEAIDAHTRARNMHQQTGNVHGEASAWNNLGNTLGEVRRFDEAIDAHTRARNLHQQTGDIHREASAWNNLGNTLRKVRRFDEAIDAHTRARNMHQQTGDIHREASAWNNLGNTLRKVRRFDEAIDAHTRARNMHQQTGDIHREASAWNNLGNTLRKVRRFDEAIDAHTRARNMHQQTGDIHGEASAWNNLGNALRKVRRFDEAIDAHTRARNMFQQTSDVHGEAGAWNGLGMALCEVRRFDEAIDAHTRARNMFQQTSDVHGEAGAWNGLGMALCEVRRFDEAIDAHIRARNMHQQTGDTHSAEMAGAGVGIGLGGLERYQEAIHILERAVAFFHQTDDRHSQGHAAYELGLVHHRSGSCDRAVPVLEEAVELLASTNDPYRHAQALEALKEARTGTQGREDRNDEPL
ncbi:tetratricopeptide repeat protein (plasmid) [Nocardiopsis flavescens]|nr:tetratricopeptide repeat protein [Nocardiopsis flavescens]